MTGLGIAVVGLGTIAQTVHLPLVRRNRETFDLTAVVDVSPSRLATVGGLNCVPEARRFSSVPALVEAVEAGTAPVDVAVLASTGSHVEDAAALVAAGIRVLVEKPLAYSLEELDGLEERIRAGSRDPSHWVRVGYMKEYDPAVRRAAELTRDLDVRAVRVEVLHPADARQLSFAHLQPPTDDIPPVVAARSRRSMDLLLDRTLGTPDPTMRALYTNVVLGSVIHDISLTRALGVPLVRVDTARRTGPGFPGSLTVVGTTVGDGVWTMGWHFIADCPEYRETVTIHHEKGTLELLFRTPYILNAPTELRVREASGPLGAAETCTTWPQEEAFEQELRMLADLGRGSDPSGSGPVQAREDLITAQALWRACAESDGITIDPQGEVGRQGRG
ncbi:Gfo/Idh/MocA family protein [Actinomyces polynesiensis]|uniref:Gfo/Idh/MocA family protein n=1 Tax=Actinomyces polynesiensis TaxID=1325934 RepID=UPI000ADEB456|nr:Gfo/Idh/MocA family oxidoreductase [Actinomyces polynesiensis]